ncbi:hypothetical protein [Leptospira congkakensis]|uniref:hypothetical protein n=1 Tax=Leptospira congkakensis TaxID=2484932 RepID=UPI001ABFF3E4|nr:hypothetical protein [Leptospira congkakensis]
MLKHLNETKIRYISIIASLLLFTLLHCGDSGYGKNKSESNDLYSVFLLSLLGTTETNLPEPTMNTVNITVGDTKYTKALGVCRGTLNVSDNIMIPGNDFTLPSFFLHKVDFTATNVSITPLGPTFIFNIDMPGGGGYDPVSSCEAKVIENSATIYDIQVKNCAVDKIAGAVTPATNTISFRARCTKGL